MRVAVVGGGIAGASVAYELAKRAEVTVFEQEATCGHHSTGRSAALFTECYGDRIVRSLAMASRPFLSSPPEGFTEAPLVHPRSLMFVATGEQMERFPGALADYSSMVPAVHEVGADEAVRRCPVIDPKAVEAAILEPDAMDIDVHALHLAFQQAARRRGARIVVSSPVSKLDRLGDGWRVQAGEHDTDFDVVVNAAGAWCDEVGRLAGAGPIGLVPKRRTAFTFEPGVDGHRSWPMVLDLDEQFYFRPEGPHLLGSPCDETPMEPCDVKHEELDVAIGIDRIQSVTTMKIRSIDHAWAGLRSFVADHRPVNGWDPQLPGFYWLAGQGGFGIKTSPAMARFAAGMILDGNPPDDLLASGVTAEALGVDRLRV